MKLRVPFAVVFLILFLCTSTVEAQSLSEYNKIVSVICNVSVDLEEFLEDTRVNNGKPSPPKSLSDRIPPHRYIDSLAFDDKNCFKGYFPRDDYRRDSIYITGCYSADEEYLDIEIIYLKQETLYNECGNEKSEYIATDIHYQIICSDLVRTIKDKSICQFEGSKFEVVTYKNVWNQEHCKNVRTIIKEFINIEPSSSNAIITFYK